MSKLVIRPVAVRLVFNPSLEQRLAERNTGHNYGGRYLTRDIYVCFETVTSYLTSDVPVRPEIVITSEARQSNVV